MKYDYYTQQGLLYGHNIKALVFLRDFGSTDEYDDTLLFHVRASSWNRVNIRNHQRESIIIEAKSQKNGTQYYNWEFSPRGTSFSVHGSVFQYFDVTDSTVDISNYSSTELFLNGVYYALYGYKGHYNLIDGSLFIIMNHFEKLFPLPKGVQV